MRETAKGSRSKSGRPSLYSDALAEKIVELIEAGYSERQIEAMEGMPSRRTMLRWKDEHPEFCRLSARAREASAALFRERALQVAIDTADLADRIANRDPDDPLALADFPKGYIDAKKLLVQELNREAAIRDDSRYGDRKRVGVELDAPKKAVPEGLTAIYAALRREANEMEGVTVEA